MNQSNKKKKSDVDVDISIPPELHRGTLTRSAADRKRKASRASVGGERQRSRTTILEKEQMTPMNCL